MSIYVVVFEKDVPEPIRTQADSVFGEDLFQLTESTWVLREDPGRSHKILERIVRDGPSSTTLALVFEMGGSFSGNYYEDFFDWILRQEDE